MKCITPFLILPFIIMSVACNKKYEAASTEIPEELSLLKGKWKVVSFYHDTGHGLDTGTSPSFNQMEFDTKKVTLSFNNDLVRKDKFRFVKEESVSVYTLSFAGKQFSTLNHYVDFRNDTLYLLNRMYDAGTTYHLVKE